MHVERINGDDEAAGLVWLAVLCILSGLALFMIGA